MSDAEKLWIQRGLNQLATSRAMEAIGATGRALPCRVIAVNVDGFDSVLTVEFEVQVPYTTAAGETQYYTLPPLTLAKAESQWLRAPVQIGDVGLTVPADTFLGGITGLGSGVARLGTQYGNLSTLVWVPIAATTFIPNPNPNQAWVNGPDGAVLSDTALTAQVKATADTATMQVGLSTVVLTATALTITIGGKTWTFTGSGITDDSGVVLETHVHGGVATGAGETGPPQAP